MHEAVIRMEVYQRAIPPGSVRRIAAMVEFTGMVKISGFLIKR
jgi:hypothetical protein